MMGYLTTFICAITAESAVVLQIMLLKIPSYLKCVATLYLDMIFNDNFVTTLLQSPIVKEL